MKKIKVDWLALVVGLLAGMTIAYTLWWLLQGFGTCAPGDFPWEDVFPGPIAEMIYWFSSLDERYIVPLVC